MTSTVLRIKVNLYPLAMLAAAFAAGIFVSGRIDLDIRLAALPTITFALLALLLRNSLYSTIFVLAGFFALGCFSSIEETHSISPDRVRSLIDAGSIPNGAPVEIEGDLISPPEHTAEGYTITVAAQRISFKNKNKSASGRVKIYVQLSTIESVKEFEDLALDHGSRISVATELSREEQYQNPGVASRIEMMDRQGIDAVATLKSPLLIENLGDSSKLAPLRTAYDLRQYLLERFHDSFSTPTAGVLTASMLGDKYFLDRSTADVFREGGTFHVLIISGLHITFIGGLVLVVVSSFTKSWAWRFVIVTSIIWAYSIAVGAEPPVMRACLMFTILLFSRVIYRQRNLLNSLGACILILLASRPSDLYNPSLQLTLISVIAIIGTAFPLIEKLRAIGSWMPSVAEPFPPNVPTPLIRFCETIYWNPIAWKIEVDRQIWSAKIIKSPYISKLAGTSLQRFLRYIFEALTVSLIVQLWLLPLSIVYFHRFTPISVVMNLWVGVGIAFESLSALAAIAFSEVSEFLAFPFFVLTEFLNYLLITVPYVFTNLGWASWRVPNYSGISSAIYAVYFLPLIGLAFMAGLWNPFRLSDQKVRFAIAGKRIQSIELAALATVACFFLAAVLIFHPYSSPAADGRMHIDFIDVGQGDSALVTFPDGRTMLIDGGGRLEYRADADDDVPPFMPDTPGVGEAVVSPVLWNKGYSKIDFIVATHADADHIQGLNDIAKNFEIGQALFGRMPHGDPEFRQLSDVLARRQIPNGLINRGMTLKFGSATVEVLYPLADSSENAASDNDHSVVLRIVYGNRAFLFTGDIESGAESDLLSRGGNLTADLIKVAHHGSRTSSTQAFIDSVRPECAVISVGRHSRFGHPHKEVVDRWLAAGVKVTTTGKRGMVSISTDGKDLNITTFK